MERRGGKNICHARVRPVSSYLNTAIRLAVPGVEVGRYSDCFSRLWSRDLPGNSLHVVILWDRTPDADEVAASCRSFVSPASWAICENALRRREHRDAIGVFVVDLSSECDELDIAGRAASLGCMPWLTVLNRSEADVWVTFPEYLRSFVQRPPELDSTFDLLRDHLAFSVLEGDSRGDYHSIANEMGPILLGEAPPTVPIHRAIINALQALNILGSSEETLPPSARFTDAGTELTAFKPPLPEIVLLDDRAEFGWRRILETSLSALAADQTFPFVSSPIEVRAFTEPDQFVTSFVSAPSGATVPDPEPDRERILFMDLRLFEHDEIRELQFIGTLVGDAERIYQATRAGLMEPKWQLVSEQELRAVKTWLHAARQGLGRTSKTTEPSTHRKQPEYLQALALLPRLTALADFSRPVILFTSSRQREIAELTKPYGNIVATVAKPRIDRIQTLRDTKRTFQSTLLEAVGQAAAWLDAARRLNATTAVPAGPSFALEPSVNAREHSDGTSVLGIYLDESGSGAPDGKSFTIGGLAVLYKNAADVEAVDAAIESAQFELAGEVFDLAFGWSNTMPPRASIVAKTRPLPHRIELRPDGESLASAAMRCLFETIGPERIVIPFALVEPYTDGTAERGDPWLPLDRHRETDVLFNDMLEESLEILIHHVAPRIPVRPLDVWVYYSSRRVTRSLAPNDDGAARKAALRDSFGIVCRDSYEDGERVFGYQSCDTASVTPRVAKLRDRVLHRDGINVSRSVACPFRYFEKHQQPRDVADSMPFGPSRNVNALEAVPWPRQIHFFADLFVKAYAFRRFQIQVPEAWHVSRCVTLRNASLREWLDVGRAARADNHARAIRNVPPEVPDNGHAGRWIRAGLTTMLEAFSGDDMLMLSALNKTSQPKYADRQPASESAQDGVVVTVDSNGIAIAVDNTFPYIVPWECWKRSFGYPYPGLAVKIRPGRRLVEPEARAEILAHDRRIDIRAVRLGDDPMCVLPAFGDLLVKPDKALRRALARDDAPAEGVFEWIESAPRMSPVVNKSGASAVPAGIGTSPRSSTQENSTHSTGRAPASKREQRVRSFGGKTAMQLALENAGLQKKDP